MDCIFEILIAWFRRFLLRGANCPETRGELSRYWWGTVWGELSDIPHNSSFILCKVSDMDPFDRKVLSATQSSILK